MRRAASGGKPDLSLEPRRRKGARYAAWARCDAMSVRAELVSIKADGALDGFYCELLELYSAETFKENYCGHGS